MREGRDERAYTYDPDKCAEEMALAWDGQVAEKASRVRDLNSVIGVVDLDLGADLRIVSVNERVDHCFLQGAQRIGGDLTA